jgi:hypothetical protein
MATRISSQQNKKGTDFTAEVKLHALMHICSDSCETGVRTCVCDVLKYQHNGRIQIMSELEDYHTKVRSWMQLYYQLRIF